MLPRALRLCSCFGGVGQITWHKTTFSFDKREIRASGKFMKVVAARKANLITARARKKMINMHTARMLTKTYREPSKLNHVSIFLTMCSRI